MKYDLVDLSEEEVDSIEENLDRYDENYITYRIDASISIGIKDANKLVAGLDGQMTAFKILYISTVYVDEAYRGLGLARRLMEEAELRARKLGANLIRLDTFNWQGKEFYKELGYEEVGFYESLEDGFSEHFYLKRI